jgi:hypothetical protein
MGRGMEAVDVRRKRREKVRPNRVTIAYNDVGAKSG